MKNKKYHRLLANWNERITYFEERDAYLRNIMRIMLWSQGVTKNTIKANRRTVGRLSLITMALFIAAYCSNVLLKDSEQIRTLVSGICALMGIFGGALTVMTHIEYREPRKIYKQNEKDIKQISNKIDTNELLLHKYQSFRDGLISAPNIKSY